MHHKKESKYYYNKKLKYLFEYFDKSELITRTVYDISNPRKQLINKMLMQWNRAALVEFLGCDYVYRKYFLK